MTLHMRTKSTLETNEHVEKLIKENEILHKNKKSQQRVNN